MLLTHFLSAIEGCLYLKVHIRGLCRHVQVGKLDGSKSLKMQGEDELKV